MDGQIGWWRVGRLVAAGVLAMSLALAASALAPRRTGEPTRSGAITVEEIDAALARARSAVVEVAADTCSGRRRGSGLVIGDQVVTNHHLVAGAATLTAGYQLEDGTGSAGLVAERLSTGRSSSGLDLALGREPDGAPSPAARRAAAGRRGAGLDLAPGDAAPGQAVIVASRAGGELRWLTATVARLEPGPAYGSEGAVLLLDRAVVGGWSGGPVLDRRSRVVGVVRGVDPTTHLTVAIPVSELHQWLSGDGLGTASTACPR